MCVFTVSGFFSSLYSLPLSPLSALSGPLASTGIYSGQRLLMQAAGGCLNRVPFRDRLEGESPRGGEGQST